MTNTPRSPRIQDWCRCEDGRWHQWLQGICVTERPEERGDVIPVTPFLSAALDQLYMQRRLMAVAAMRIQGIAGLVRMSKARQATLTVLAEQLRRTARGNPRGPLFDEGRMVIADAIDKAGWDGNLTRSRWEQETFGTGIADRVTW